MPIRVRMPSEYRMRARPSTRYGGRRLANCGCRPVPPPLPYDDALRERIRTQPRQPRPPRAGPRRAPPRCGGRRRRRLDGGRGPRRPVRAGARLDGPHPRWRRRASTGGCSTSAAAPRSCCAGGPPGSTPTPRSGRCRAAASTTARRRPSPPGGSSTRRSVSSSAPDAVLGLLDDYATRSRLRHHARRAVGRRPRRTCARTPTRCWRATGSACTSCCGRTHRGSSTSPRATGRSSRCRSATT